MTLARCSPLSPKTNRALRHRPSSCRLLTRAFVPAGPRPRGPAGAAVLSPHCLNEMHARQMFVFEERPWSTRCLSLLCSLSSHKVQAELLFFVFCRVVWRVNADIKTTQSPFTATRLRFQADVDVVVMVMMAVCQVLSHCEVKNGADWESVFLSVCQ